MTHKSTIESEALSDLERRINSEVNTSSKSESFYYTASQKAKYILDLYFKPKAFERSGKLYELLGVRRFKKFMFSGDYMNALIRKMNPNYRLIEEEHSARNWEMFTRFYEGAHMAGFTLFGYTIINELTVGNSNSAAISLAENMLINVYPIMLQRYNRARIYNVLDNKLKKQQVLKTTKTN